MPKRIEIITGKLSWPRTERVSDRYGRIRMFGPRDEVLEKTGSALAEEVRVLNEQRVRLGAVVVATRQSGHIGDLFRGIRPTTPEVGEEIIFGEGEFIIDADEYGRIYGIKPDEPRESDHMDPKKLYRAHDQDVVLFVETIG